MDNFELCTNPCREQEAMSSLVAFEQCTSFTYSFEDRFLTSKSPMDGFAAASAYLALSQYYTFLNLIEEAQDALAKSCNNSFKTTQLRSFGRLPAWIRYETLKNETESCKETAIQLERQGNGVAAAEILRTLGSDFYSEGYALDAASAFYQAALFYFHSFKSASSELQLSHLQYACETQQEARSANAELLIPNDLTATCADAVQLQQAEQNEESAAQLRPDKPFVSKINAYQSDNEEERKMAATYFTELPPVQISSRDTQVSLLIAVAQDQDRAKQFYEDATSLYHAVYLTYHIPILLDKATVAKHYAAEAKKTAEDCRKIDKELGLSTAISLKQ